MNNKLRRTKQRTNLEFRQFHFGFTLVELLVVIAIISILSTILMVSFSGIRERSRDARRKSELLEIKTALETYRADMGFYPVSQGATPTAPNIAFPSNCGTNVAPVPLTGSNGTVYMRNIPCDPKDGTAYVYTATGNSQYTLRTCVENIRDKEAVTSDTTTCGTTRRPFSVVNP